MKTTFRPKEKPKTVGNALRIAFALLVVALVIFHGPVIETLRGALTPLLSPLLKAQTVALSIASDMTFRSREELALENASLRRELETMRLALLDKELLVTENTELNQALGRKGDSHAFILGNVLAKPNRSLYDTLLLDIGESDGITTGMTVYVGSSTPLGTIVEVSTKTSLVRLFSSSGEHIAVDIGSERVPAEAVGVGGGNFRIFLPKDTTIIEGDFVRLAGQSLSLLGTIEKIERNESETLARIYFKTPVSPYSLSRVFVRLY